MFRFVVFLFSTVDVQMRKELEKMNKTSSCESCPCSGWKACRETAILARYCTLLDSQLD